MKKLLFIFLLGFANSFAQGNLQFNRVVNFSSAQVNGTSYTRGDYIYQSFTIPAGKVWKIENVMVASGSLTEQGYVAACPSCAAAFNGIIAYIYYTSGYAPDNAKFPIWLSEGNYNFIITDNNGTSVTDVLRASYSAIEFNVISN
jgi:hypothetical protein